MSNTKNFSSGTRWSCNQKNRTETNACRGVVIRRMAARVAGPLALAFLVFTVPAPATAQRLIATVNNSPVTNYDLGQRMRLLRALRMKSGKAAAMESLVETRLKLNETKKYGIVPSQQQVLRYIGQFARKRKIPSQRLAYSLQRGGIDQVHWQEHFKAQMAWDSLIQALYKSVGVSITEVNQELSKRGKTTDKTEYRLRQIVLIVPRTAGAGTFNRRLREANGLRTRFTSCEQGIKYARSLNDVAIQGLITRRAASLTPAVAKMLAQTPVGKLTRASRGATGVEMIAVCGKKNLSGQVAAGSTITQELKAKKLKVHSDRRYNELRKRALIIRR